MAQTEMQQRVMKVTGAVECLQALLEHCADHTIPVTQDVVWNYLQTTKKELELLQLEQLHTVQFKV